MSSPSARSEARRKAILARGTDRLSKLTASARPDDPVYVAQDSPATTPLKPALSSSNTLTPTVSSPQSLSASDFTSPWTEQQQQQFMAALMGATPPPDSPVLAPTFVKDTGIFTLDPAPSSNQSSTLFSGASPSLTARAERTSTRTLISLGRILPLVHILSMLSLLTYFVLRTSLHSFGAPEDWRVSLGHWGSLLDDLRPHEYVAERGPSLRFLWVFISLELGLHASRIVLDRETLEPPTMLGLILPSLPQSISTFVTTILRYSRMASLLLDDIAILVVGLGLLVSLSGWFTV